MSDLHHSATPDAIQTPWIDRAPPRLQPYLRLARLDRPIGTWLLLLPCWWGVTLANLDVGLRWSDARLLALFAIGAIVMRGAGCTFNDIVDRDIDAQVERTRNRPIPSGAVSVRGAAIFVVLQSLAGLAVLLTLNDLTRLLGIASLGLVAVYPFMKRITHWPQAVLGLAFNWGALMGYAAKTGTLSWGALALYLAGVAWTLGYDTIYAHQDKDDDAIIGVKSTALKFGAATRTWLIGFYGATLALLLVAGRLSGAQPGFYLVLVLVLAHFLWQVRKLDIDNPERCLTLFRANRSAGGFILLAIAAGAL